MAATAHIQPSPHRCRPAASHPLRHSGGSRSPATLTGIANIIIRPDIFAGERLTIIEEPFLLIEGTLQNLEGVTSVRAERLGGIGGTPVEIDARNLC